jgi:hypothetical protein
VVVGGWLLEEQHVKLKKVVVLKVASPALKEFLRKHDIEMWSPS